MPLAGDGRHEESWAAAQLRARVPRRPTVRHTRQIDRRCKRGHARIIARRQRPVPAIVPAPATFWPALGTGRARQEMPLAGDASSNLRLLSCAPECHDAQRCATPAKSIADASAGIRPRSGRRLARVVLGRRCRWRVMGATRNHGHHRNWATCASSNLRLLSCAPECHDAQRCATPAKSIADAHVLAGAWHGSC
jgi:antitoxin (DNA-binding transcriptional repressor) of toxin-antitoxin stability system